MAASAARQQQCADLDRWQAIGHAAGRLRGATLNAMAADDIESVEVINNPGAQFGNEAGGGPILNLVMRRNRKPGGFGTVNANAGIAGRYNSSVSGSYNEGPWGYQGGINVRHDGRNSVGEVSRERLDRGTGRLPPAASNRPAMA
jgi:hypothetical protein